MRTKPIILNVLAAAVVASCSTDLAFRPITQDAVITFAFDGWPQDTIRVLVRDSATVSHAINYLLNKSGPKIPIGPIYRGTGVDTRYPFYFDPDSVRLTEVAIELCDGRLMRTAAEVNTFMLGATGNPNAAKATWCPWGAYPVKVDTRITQ